MILFYHLMKWTKVKRILKLRNMLTYKWIIKIKMKSQMKIKLKYLKCTKVYLTNLNNWTISNQINIMQMPKSLTNTELWTIKIQMNNYQFVVITVVNLNYFQILNYKMVTRKVMVIKVIKFTQKEKITIINILKTSKTK